MNNIDDALVEETVPHYGELRPILVGSFNVSRASIPFFQATMSMEDVSNTLKLVENLPSDLRSKWRLEELFQREIDWRRVKDEIADGYLRRPEKLQFFNSLTVALLPVDQKGLLANAYGEASKAPKPRDALTKEPWRTRDVGGVQLVTNGQSPHGFIRWDPKRIFPATIDGQHRLAALQMLFRDGNLTARNQETTIPVIFLVLDPRAGLLIEEKQAAPDENPILTVVREIFIDLNKTSVEVRHSRRILLDDQEIEARAVRRLMAHRVGEWEDGRLPLGLVHWQHKVTAKFNAGEQTAPFITTVELLHAIVQDVLELKPPRHPFDETEIRTFVKSVEDALSVSQVIANNDAKYPGLKKLIDYVEQNYLKEGFEQPLSSLPSQYLRAADQGFDQNWKRVLVDVLLRFKPYKAFVEQVKLRGGIDGDLAFYLALPEKAQVQQAKDWGDLRPQKIDKPLRDLAAMKNEDWCFFAVFQKGLLSATADAWRHVAVVPGGADQSVDAFLNAWIAFLDDLHDRKLLAVKSPFKSPLTGESQLLWSGIALNPGAKTVKWNESAVQRIGSLLTLWWYFHASKLQRVGSFIKALDSKASNEKYPNGKKHIESLRKGLKSAVVIGDEDVQEAVIERRVNARLRDILKLAGNAEVKMLDDDNDDTESKEPTDTDAPPGAPSES